MAKNPAIDSPADSLADLYAAGVDGLRAEAARLHGVAERFREQYRTRLDEWMQLRARIDQRATPRRPVGPGPESLRVEHERMGRDLAVLQARLKRIDLAAAQLDLLGAYLARNESHAEEPTLTDADASPAATRLRIIQAQEAERQRLAEDVHDGPAQVLTNAIFQVEYLDRVLGDSPEVARAELAFLRTMLRDGLDDVRSFIVDLRPPVVDVGVAKALQDQATDFESRHGISVRVAVNGLDARLSPSAKASTLRIAQEALQNVRKHAAASEVRIGLEGDYLTIADNGRGFDVMRLASGATRNFGLQFMRERAELMGSELRIESRQGEGTRILLRLPENAR